MTGRLASSAVLLAILVGPAGQAGASDEDGGLARLWRRVQAAIDDASAALAPVPPIKVAVQWKPEKLASVDLGAPVLAIDIADLDRDGTGELMVLTASELVLMQSSSGRFSEVARIDLGGDLAAIGPRDPVGTLWVEERTGQRVVWARSSDRADAVALGYDQGVLSELARQPGFPLCADVTLDLVAGRNIFDGSGVNLAGAALPNTLWSLACPGDLVGPDGRALAVTGMVDATGSLRVTCQQTGGQPCAEGPAQNRSYANRGHAFAISDFDNDGVAEVVATSDSAFGDRDRVVVMAIRDGRVTALYSRDFHAGVAAMAAGDIDGDGGRELIVAVRFAGSSRTGLWQLGGGAP